jgi:predicted nucleic acid-binding protein
LRVAADSSVWVSYLHGYQTPHTLCLDQLIEKYKMTVPDLVLLEILRGVKSDSAAEAVALRFASFDIVNIGGQENVIAAAKNYRMLRALGITIRGSVDVLIGTWCLKNEVSLLHNDRDFDMMEKHLGLKCVGPPNMQ